VVSSGHGSSAQPAYISTSVKPVPAGVFCSCCAGIGGMHYALQRACPGAVVLDAFDINHAANEVYAHNFGRRPKQVCRPACSSRSTCRHDWCGAMQQHLSMTLTRQHLDSVPCSTTSMWQIVAWKPGCSLGISVASLRRPHDTAGWHRLGALDKVD
jgi:hypothetical protein